MRVIRTIESFYPVISGPANQVFMISNELEKKGIKSPVLTSNYKAKKSPFKEKFERVNVLRFDYSFKIMKYLVTPTIKEAFKKFDIVHCHSHRSYQTAISYKQAKKYGKKFVISPHGSLLGYSQYLKGIAKLPYIIYDIFGGKQMIKNADAVIVNSKKEYCDAIKYGVSENKLHLLPVGIHINEYSPMKKKSDVFRVLFVGRICKNRNIAPIIKAAKIIKKEIANNKKFKKNKKIKKIEFLIVGGEVKTSDTNKSGYLSSMKQLSKDLDVTDYVKFLGEKRGKELKKYYRTSDVFVYTSDSENFGQTILEAGAAGLPIICTKVGIAPEIIKNGQNGFLVKADASQIADRIQRLFETKKREKYGKKTREIVRNNFSWDVIISEYIKIYKTISRSK